MSALHQESENVNFYWSSLASLEKKNFNKTLSFTKITLLVLGFCEITEEAQN